MQTTALFVELLVIGVQSSAWLVSLSIVLLGNDQLDRVFPSIDFGPSGLWLVVPALAAVYTTGAVFDRVADWLVERLSETFSFVQGREIQSALLKLGGATEIGYRILHESEGLRDIYHYYRGRVRVIRSFMFNSLPIFVLGSIWIAQESALERPGLVALTFAGGGILIFVATVLAFLKINRDYYRRLLQMHRALEWREQHSEATE